MLRFTVWCCPLGLLAVAALFSPLLCGFASASPGAKAKGIAFFENKVRPILTERCFECHSEAAGKQKGGLLLDRRSGWMDGGDSGPAVVPGNPGRSLLVKAVRHLDPDFAMPDDKLPDEEIAALMHWVKIGAPGGKNDIGETEFSRLGDQVYLSEEAKTHWAFQPLRPGPLPEETDFTHPVDRFLAASWEGKDVEVSAQADRRTWMRRLSFDLIGLPPTHSEVTDPANAPLRVVLNRLLDSPAFGERWARHWLDLARYADTREFLAAGADTRYPYAYTYRDYVIDAFNADKPVDAFIREQLAADLLPEDERAETDLAALGFLTVGSRFRGNRAEIYNDRIDVVTRGFLGLTVACARCHDHMYDAIPTTDYYALYGVFNSVTDPTTYPEIPCREGACPEEDERKDFEAKRAREVATRRVYMETLATEARADFRDKAGAYLERTHDMLFKGHDARKALTGAKLKETALTPLTNNLRNQLRNKSNEKDKVFGPLLGILRAPEKDFVKIRNAVLAMPMSPGLKDALTRKPLPANRRVFMTRYGEALAAAAKAEDRLVNGALAREGGPFWFTPEASLGASRLFGPGRTKIANLERAINDVDATHPGAPPRAMVVAEKPRPVEGQVFIRGNVATRGERVPRRFLTQFGGAEFGDDSGRLELANAIVETPLAARVYANRVWMHTMGESLVETPGDYGLQAPEPVQARLLDFLAKRLVDSGWSTKTLVRLIVTSEAYRRSSLARPAMMRLDPENRLYARGNVRRLSFEAMRDATLAVAGNLDRTMFGRAEDITTVPFSRRRTVYGFIDRVNLDDIFATFNFPSPDTIAPERAETMVPQQALFSMNDPFLHEQARQLANHTIGSVKAEGEVFRKRLTAVYNAVFQRDPTQREFVAGQRFMQAAVEMRDEPRPRDWRYGYGPADPEIAADERFTELKFWDRKRRSWQTSKVFPHPKTGHVRLSANGGHPGRNNVQSTVLRWTAPLAGTYAIAGELAHPAKIENGDGVRASVLHSRHGVLKRVNVLSRTKPVVVERVECEAGDIIDFIVSPMDSPLADSYGWSPEVRSLQMSELVPPGQRTTWVAQTDFRGPLPPLLTPWQQLAHALLMSNEFHFLD